jgi:hypothetical protein
LPCDSFLVRKVLVIAPLRVRKGLRGRRKSKSGILKGLNYSGCRPEQERRFALMRNVDVFIINRENVELAG